MRDGKCYTGLARNRSGTNLNKILVFRFPSPALPSDGIWDAKRCDFEGGEED